jgi:hypothetical protein
MAGIAMAELHIEDCRFQIEEKSAICNFSGVAATRTTLLNAAWWYDKFTL